MGKINGTLETNSTISICSTYGTYDSRLDIYDSAVDDSKIMHEILYDWYGAILGADYDQPVGETLEKNESRHPGNNKFLKIETSQQ